MKKRVDQIKGLKEVVKSDLENGYQKAGSAYRSRVGPKSTRFAETSNVFPHKNNDDYWTLINSCFYMCNIAHLQAWQTR